MKKRTWITLEEARNLAFQTATARLVNKVFNPEHAFNNAQVKFSVMTSFPIVKGTPQAPEVEKVDFYYTSHDIKGSFYYPVKVKHGDDEHQYYIGTTHGEITDEMTDNVKQLIEMFSVPGGVYFTYHGPNHTGPSSKLAIAMAMVGGPPLCYTGDITRGAHMPELLAIENEVIKAKHLISKGVDLIIATPSDALKSYAARTYVSEGRIMTVGADMDVKTATIVGVYTWTGVCMISSEFWKANYKVTTERDVDPKEEEKKLQARKAREAARQQYAGLEEDQLADVHDGTIDLYNGTYEFYPFDAPTFADYVNELKTYVEGPNPGWPPEIWASRKKKYDEDWVHTQYDAFKAALGKRDAIQIRLMYDAITHALTSLENPPKQKSLARVIVTKRLAEAEPAEEKPKYSIFARVPEKVEAKKAERRKVATKATMRAEVKDRPTSVIAKPKRPTFETAADETEEEAQLVPRGKAAVSVTGKRKSGVASLFGS